jgi:hypothetical protein
MTLTEMHWLLRQKSKLSTSNKILIYKAIFKPIWIYWIQLWSMISTSNIEILECFQSKILHMILDTPLYVPNMVIWRDLQMPTVKKEICNYTSQYCVCLSAHQNDLVVHLMVQPESNRPLQRHLPNDLPIKFLVWLSYLQL